MRKCLLTCTWDTIRAQSDKMMCCHYLFVQVLVPAAEEAIPTESWPESLCIWSAMIEPRITEFTQSPMVQSKSSTLWLQTGAFKSVIIEHLICTSIILEVSIEDVSEYIMRWDLPTDGQQDVQYSYITFQYTSVDPQLQVSWLHSFGGMFCIFNYHMWARRGAQTKGTCIFSR